MIGVGEMKGVITSIEGGEYGCLLTVRVSLPEFGFKKNWDEMGPKEKRELRHSEEYKKALEEQDILTRSILSSLTLGEIDFHYTKEDIGYCYARNKE